MVELDIAAATTSNMTDTVEAVTIPSRNTEGVQQQKETEYRNVNFTKWYGIYRGIPEVKIAFDMRAVWTIGKGYEASPATTVILDHVTGNGKDTFNAILKNLFTIKRVAGDSYAEIIRDPDSGTLINLKPLDPLTITIIYNSKGIIQRYEQTDKIPLNKKAVHKFKPSEIFHLSNKRVADELGGTSDIEALENIINANNESFDDMRKLMHRFVKPMVKFILDEDDPVKIDALVAKFDTAVNKGENLYVPKGVAEHELITVPSNATLNPLPWREHLKNYYFQVVGIPQIILGSSGEFTESTAKIAYLAFEQSVDDEQNEIEAQIWNQLGIRIKLTFPASLRNELLSDEAKDSKNNFQENDTQAGAGQ